MSIVIKNNKKIVIDKTFPEIIKKSKKVNNNVSIKFLTLLKKLGVDFIQIDRKVLSEMKNIPKDFDYIYKIKNISDIYFINKCRIDFKYLVLDYKDTLKFNKNTFDLLKNRKIILEINIQILDELYSEKANLIFNSLNIKCIRIKNIIKYDICGWTKLIENIRNEFNVNIDICANSKYYMSTAISIETCIDGANSITAAFNGQAYGFASLEEVIMGLKVIKNGKTSGSLKLIGEIAKIYTELTNEEVYPMKPVIGRDIFKYESGIHVDGIEKNPNTYEPYNPYDIGEKRTMYIGKHSGKKAVVLRLQELNIDYKNINIDEFLKRIRETSIKLKRNIFNDELVEMYNQFKNTCLK